MILPQVQVHKFTIQSFNLTDLRALHLMSTLSETIADTQILYVFKFKRAL